MGILRLAVSLLVSAATSTVFTQTSPQSSPAGPTFDVVSVRPNSSNSSSGSSLEVRPNGALIATNIRVGTLISRAYPPAAPNQMVGLPGWAMSEGYDVSATSSLSSPTPDERTAMLRAVLADRFKLLVHIENREQPVYDLVLARGDGRLGPGMTLVDVDCARVEAERKVSPSRPVPDFKSPPPPCTMRQVNAFLRDREGDKLGRLGDLLEGDTTMANLAGFLRVWAGRSVVNKTGLPGVYRVRMDFDSMALRRGPDPTGAGPDGPPSLFTALPEQLGLRLESSRELIETLVIDRLERPTENP